MSGFGGCNRIFGRVDEDGAIGPLGRTMMAGPPEIMAQEDALLALLERAKSQVVGETDSKSVTAIRCCCASLVSMRRFVG